MSPSYRIGGQDNEEVLGVELPTGDSALIVMQSHLPWPAACQKGMCQAASKSLRL